MPRLALLRRVHTSLLVGVLTAPVAALLATAGPASADGGCPRPDNTGNVAVVRGSETAHLPGSTNADFCGAVPDHASTQVWNDGPAWNVKRLAVPGVGTWRIATSGRISFTPDTAFTRRPAGDAGPGHDAILKYKVITADRHFKAGLATVYVLYPGSTARPDVARTEPGRSVDVQPLRNDVASWSGETRATLRQARFGTDSVRLAGAEGDERRVSTQQGTWRVSDRTVTFSPAGGFTGTAVMRYRSTDSRDEQSGSTISVVVGDGSAPAAVAEVPGKEATDVAVAATATDAPASAMRAPVDDEAPVSARVWVPVAGASLLAGLVLFILRSRRRRA